MKSVAIDDKALLSLCQRIRQLKELTIKERREVVEIILKEIDLIKKDHVENLVCIQHAMKLRGYANHSSVYRTRDRNHLHVYTICCRDYFEKAELEALPVKGSTQRKARVKVGML